jgi:hypothetical protein
LSRGEKYFPRQKKEIEIETLGEDPEEGKEISHPRATHRHLYKFDSTLCFSALKTSLPDFASGDGVVMCWIWPCPGVETGVDDNI